jgi:ATP-dependent DNA helicase RecG
MNRAELQQALGILDRKYFNLNFLNPALKHDLIEMTFPDKPKSSKQKYRRKE